MKRNHKHNEEAGEVMPLPKLVSKRANRRSNFYTGRTITEKKGTSRESFRKNGSAEKE